jgi:hypothetical protein
MNLPGFTAEAALDSGGRQRWTRNRGLRDSEMVVPAATLTWTIEGHDPDNYCLYRTITFVADFDAGWAKAFTETQNLCLLQ